MFVTEQVLPENKVNTRMDSKTLGMQNESGNRIYKVKHKTCFFIPPNATSKLQSLDRGIVKVLKQKYREKTIGFTIHERNAK